MELTFAILTIISLGLWIGLRHSFFSVPLVIFLSLWVQDFFPLSHFPMYSDPNESENYFYVATVDGEGEIIPAPVRGLTGITAPKVKKIFKSMADEEAGKIGKKRDDLDAQQRAVIGRELLMFLSDQADVRGNDFPEIASLVEVWIVYDNETGISETTKVVATLPTK